MNMQMDIPASSRSYETIYGDKYSYHTDGLAAISAITVGKLGGECALLSHIGDDANGDKLYDYYKRCLIDTAYLKRIKNVQTGLGFAATDGLRSHKYYVKGANLTITKGDIDEAFGCFPDLLLVPQDNLLVMAGDNSGVVSEHTENDTVSRANVSVDVEERASYKTVSMPITSRPESLTLYAVNKAMERGVNMAVEYNEFTGHLPLSEVTGIKMLVISDEMLQRLTGIAPTTIEKTLSALFAFSKKVAARYYIVQQGNDTSFVYDGKYFEIAQAPSVITHLSHQTYTHMHNTYMGAMVSEYLNTKDIVHACQFANIVSLMTRAPMGIFNHVPNRAELEAFMKECGVDPVTLK